ncbi:MAG TPA: hypothetical protein VGI39_24210 [Polyangiaceae bacterium]
MGILKTCSCGRAISPESWGRLPLIGTADNGRGIGELLELRNCTCGSTVAIAIGIHGPPSSKPFRLSSMPPSSSRSKSL